MSEGLLKGKVALVTGASRGIGKGIAQVLVEAGATVYITGRKHTEKTEFKSVKETAEELNQLEKGKCIPEYCDHKNDSETQKVFDIIEKRENKLDILVNNAFSGLDIRKGFSADNFWEGDYKSFWEKIIDVGLRSNYIAMCMALKLMVPQRKGLIVNISSIGGLVPLFNPVYGIGKEGNDRLSVDMGNYLRDYNICVVSLWPGLVRTEMMQKLFESNDSAISNTMLKKGWHLSESVILSGRAVLALATDPNVLKQTAKIHTVADLAHEYDFKDIDGKYPASIFSLRFVLERNFPSIGQYIPHFLQVPKSILSYYYSKF